MKLEKLQNIQKQQESSNYSMSKYIKNEKKFPIQKL